jgi:hypothetical protein
MLHVKWGQAFGFGTECSVALRGIVHRNADGRTVRFERSDSLFCVTPLSLRVPFRGRDRRASTVVRTKLSRGIAATTETRKIVSVSMPVLNSIFAMQAAFFVQNAVH